MTAPTNIATGLARIGSFIRAEQWRDSDVSGLTPTQAQILIHLAQRGPARVTAVAEEIAVTQPTASDSVAALVRKGLIEKRPDPDDARAVSLHPTRKGKRAADALTLWPDALLAAADTLAPEEQAAFLKGLTKMIRTLQSDGAIPVQRMCATCSFFRPNVHADPAKPHHCAFVDAAFGDASLRLYCGDHVEADTEEGDRNWRRFTSHASAE